LCYVYTIKVHNIVCAQDRREVIYSEYLTVDPVDNCMGSSNPILSYRQC
jgi:hypothetical protein